MLQASLSNNILQDELIKLPRDECIPPLVDGCLWAITMNAVGSRMKEGISKGEPSRSGLIWARQKSFGKVIDFVMSART